MRTVTFQASIVGWAAVAAIAAAAPAAAAPAQSPGAGQSTREEKIRVQTTVHVNQEIRDALREATRAISSAATDVTRDLSRDLGLQLSRLDAGAIGDALGVALGRLGDLAQAAAAGHGSARWRDGQSSTFRAAASDKQTRTLDIGPTGTLEIQNNSGDITVKVGAGSSVSAEFLRHARGRTDADARKGLDDIGPAVSSVGSRGTIKVGLDGGAARSSAYGVAVDMIITAPAGTRIVATSLSSDVHVTGITGEISVNVASGDVVISDAGASVTVNTANGDVRVTRAGRDDGMLDVGTLNGDVHLVTVSAARLKASSLNGDVEVRDARCASTSVSSLVGSISYEGDLVKGGRYELSTNTGDINFRPGDAVGYSVEATSATGEIAATAASLRTAAPRRTGLRQSLSGTVGDGSSTVTLRTFTGSITIGGRRAK